MAPPYEEPILIHSTPEVTRRFPSLLFFSSSSSSILLLPLLCPLTASTPVQSPVVLCVRVKQHRLQPFNEAPPSIPTSKDKFSRKVTNKVKIFIRQSAFISLSFDIQGLLGEQKRKRKNVAETEVICAESMSRKIYYSFYIPQQMRCC